MKRSRIAEQRFLSSTLRVITPSCYSCRHRATYPLYCTAFPTGIPAAILGGEHDHKTPFPGDHGVQYTPKD